MLVRYECSMEACRCTIRRYLSGSSISSRDIRLEFEPLGLPEMVCSGPTLRSLASSRGLAGFPAQQVTGDNCARGSPLNRSRLRS
jgi:hypothetical protein